MFEIKNITVKSQQLEPPPDQKIDRVMTKYWYWRLEEFENKVGVIGFCFQDSFVIMFGIFFNVKKIWT